MLNKRSHESSLATPHLHAHVVSGIDNALSEDDRAALAAIGKAQVYHRKFNFWSALGLTVCISGTVRLQQTWDFVLRC